MEEGKYWLCITNSENWEITREHQIWGVSERHKGIIEKVEEGDNLVFYTIMEKKEGKMVDPQIVGIYKAASKSFKEEKVIFKPVGTEKEVFPYRVKLEQVYVPEQSISFRKLIPEMEFITNKKRWNTHLFGRAMREISRKDFETILSALKENGN